MGSPGLGGGPSGNPLGWGTSLRGSNGTILCLAFLLLIFFSDGCDLWDWSSASALGSDTAVTLASGWVSAPGLALANLLPRFTFTQGPVPWFTW